MAKTATTASKLSFLWQGKAKDWLCLFILMVVITAVFAKTIFLGKAISHAYLLGNRDLLFREFLSQPYQYDESCYLMVVPSWFLAADYIRNLELPLWNSYSGWGQPFAGDISLSVASPLRFLFCLNPCLRLYNVLLVVPVLVGCLGTYLMARSLRISRLPSIFAAISYSLCPFFLFYGELSSGTAFFYSPFVAWFFVRLANRLTLSRALAVGIASGIFILSGHPETCFLGIGYGSLLLLAMSGKRPLLGENGRRLYLARTSLMLLVAAVSAFCICSISFLEFISYALRGCSYKFAAAPSVIPWQTICLNLMQPLYAGDSPFVGSLTLPLAAVALAHGKHRKYILKVLGLLFLCFFFLGTRPGVLASMFQNTPVNWIPGTYCVPGMYLSISLLAAFGLAAAAKEPAKKPVLITYILGCLLCLLIPPVLYLSGFDFKNCDFENAMKTSSSFDWKIWTVNLVVLVTPPVLPLLARNRRASYLIFCCSIIVGGFVSQALVAKYAWPVVPPFELKENDPIPLLRKLNERICVIGYDVMSANDNTIFKIRSLSVHSPLVLERYQNFAEFIDTGQIGFATTRTFNTVFKKNVMSRAFDMAAAPYILSLLPIRAAGETFAYKRNDFGGHPVVFASNNARVEMLNASLHYDQSTSCVIGTVNWMLPENLSSRLICSLIICDKAGNPFWFGNTQVIKKDKKAASGLPVVPATTNVEAIVPLDLENSQKFELRIEVRDSNDSSVVPTAEKETSVLLGKYRKGVKNLENKAHYEPIYESRPHFIRVYRNNLALPRAYVVKDVEQVRTSEECLRKLADKSFDAHQKVLIETKTVDASLNFSCGQNVFPPAKKVDIVIDRPNYVSMSTDVSYDGMLVLTDMFFPGWEARVDGRKVNVYCANYAFRGVLLPAGKHKVEFLYNPVTFQIGVALLLAFVLVAPAALMLSRRRSQRRSAL